MDQPAYYPLAAENVPTTQSQDGKIQVRVFSGEVLNTRGPIPSQAVVNAATIFAASTGRIQIPVPATHNVVLYLLDGKISVDGFGLIEGHHLIHFKNDGEAIQFTALEDTRLLFLSGEPLHENVVSYGPFVMNTQTQIMEAMRDYQIGKMGVLIEE